MWSNFLLLAFNEYVRKEGSLRKEKEAFIHVVVVGSLILHTFGLCIEMQYQYMLLHVAYHGLIVALHFNSI